MRWWGTLWALGIGCWAGISLLVVAVMGTSRLLARERADVIYHSARGDNDEIYALDINLGLERNLTRHPAWDSYPARSPDGTHVVFSSLRDSNQELYVMRVDGSDVRRLTDHPARDYHPSWSPDGQKIAFASDRSGNWDIYVMQADGTQVKQLTFDRADDDDPVWSPDGTRLAFTSYRFKNWAVYLMLPDGSSVQLVTDTRVRNLDPAWSLDGSRLLVTSDPFTRNFELYTIEANGSDPVRLTTNQAWDGGAVWVDDRRIVFYSTRDNPASPELYLMSMADGQTRRLTYNTARDSDPS